MSDNLDKLKGHSNVRQDINRRDAKQGEIIGDDGKKLQKRIDDVRKVITDPDVWNVNIASRDRVDELELEVKDLSSRVRGLSYLVRRLVMNKRIQDDQLQVLEEPTEVSGSSD
tara:strand:+ start:1497 stop:1835 length:339 start_codon:yes stop_codon:yes gene_type:complete